MRITIVSVPVSDPERAKRFYTDVLGFTVEDDEPMGPDMRWVRLAPPGGGASITLVTWFPSMPAGSVRGLVYEVDDIDAVHADLTAKGIAFPDGIQQESWGRYVTLDDPDGNGIVLSQSTDG